MLFEHSKLTFQFRNTFIPFGKLTEFVTEWDITIRKVMKPILGFPENTSTPYIYGSRDYGGVGLTSTLDEYIVH